MIRIYVARYTARIIRCNMRLYYVIPYRKILTFHETVHCNWLKLLSNKWVVVLYALHILFTQIILEGFLTDVYVDLVHILIVVNLTQFWICTFSVTTILSMLLKSRCVFLCTSFYIQFKWALYIYRCVATNWP